MPSSLGTSTASASVTSGIPAIADALAVDVPSEDGTGDGHLYLFVVPAPGHELTDDTRASIKQAIRQDCSPRHVPNEIIEAPEIPKTLTGKLLEVPVKRLLMGRTAQEAASRDALANPAALDWFIDFAAQQRRAAVRD